MVENIFIIAFVLSFASVVQSQWTCSVDADCSGVGGAVCLGGLCSCLPSQQVVLGGTVCADLAPYHASKCVEDHQCSRLFGSFQCRRESSETEGICLCKEGYHYLSGRCWKSVGYGRECTTNEECISDILDPFSLKCDKTCVCADGYYERQRGECRKIAYAVGDGCVLDEDCQFDGGICDITTLTCRNGNDITKEARKKIPSKINPYSVNTRAQFTECDIVNTCPEPFICSNHGVCVCPIGYYGNEDGNLCLAELGSPSTEEQCTGFFTEVRDGLCVCQPNFFYDEDMRNCVKVARSRTDFCLSDATCHTFGAASKCGEPQEWGFRICECIPELSVWEEERQMCRLFASIGEMCEVDSDCLAGELEIQCVAGEDGVGYCACPDGLIEYEGLCIQTGLKLNDACQVTLECSGSPNTECLNGKCSCENGYQELDGFCAPIIGGACTQNSDCVIENTICLMSICQCNYDFVEYEDSCWPKVEGYQSECNLTVQCVDSVGEGSWCDDGTCLCGDGYHHSDGGCWPSTGLFQTCSRSSQCFLSGFTERVECRNSLCQCKFDYEFSEELQTCLSKSSAANIAGGLLSVIITFIYIFK